MCGSIEFGKCKCCGKEAPLSRKYFYYDIKCECCSPKHFVLIKHCKDCEPKEPMETKVLLSTEKLLQSDREIEQLRVQLAGCGVAALGEVENTAKPDDYGWSQSYQDVLNLRLKYNSLNKTTELNSILCLSDINSQSVEGKLLIATLGRLSAMEGYSDKHPDDILKEMADIAKGF